ncbi:homeobox-leucine zipper protein ANTHOCYANINLESS [Trifolium repens]|nr:homeobox-leucine zipper protein ANTHOCYANINLESS [Trifolium repens]
MAEPDFDLRNKSSESGKEEFNHNQYERIRFPFNTLKLNCLVAEATRESVLLCINAAALIETFMDADWWAEMFPCMIVEAETLDVFFNGIDGTKNRSIQLVVAHVSNENDLPFTLQ